MNKIYQQNIFGGEDEVITQIPVYVYRNEKTGKYLASDMDHVDFSDDNGDVTEFIDMLVHFNKTYTEPSFEQAARAPGKYHGAENVKDYIPELRHITIEEFNLMADEYELPRYEGVTI